MKVLFKEVGKEVEQKEVKDFEEMQKLIGGYVEMVRCGNGIYLLADEDGRYKQLDFNFFLPNGVSIVGNVIFIRTDKDGEFTSVEEEDKDYIVGIIEEV